MNKMLTRTVILSFLLVWSFGLQAQIPDSRTMDWSQAGVVGGIPTGWGVINAIDHGIVANGSTDNTVAINNLINSSISYNKVIKFPAGSIRCEGQLDFPVAGHRIIRGTLSGTGEKLTKFIFNTGTIGNLTGNFNVENGYKTGSEIVVSGGYSKGSTQLTLASTDGISVGDYIELRQDNDMSIMGSYRSINMDASWYARTIGQIFQVKAVNASSKVVTLSRSVRFNYSASFNPRIQELKVTEKVGFEDFYTENLRTGNKASFYFEMAANCWIKNVHSFMTVNAHVNMLQSQNLTIRESFFDHSWEHGDGGRGYGVVAGDRTGDCLIEHNEFTRLRHSMMTKQSANGNVFGYNYSHDNINIYNSSNPTVDISVHGHYSYMNLFEGNSVEWIHSADWWGPSGPGTTFFRNKVVWWDIFLDDNSQDQNVVGNELSNTSKEIRVHSSVKNPFIHGNIVGNSVSWDPKSGTDNLKDSYYLSSKPSFLKSSDPWPLYGPKSGTAPTAEPEQTVAPAEDGTILWEIWRNISGTNLTDVPFSQAPSEKKNLLQFEGPLNIEDSYGSRLSGLIVPPTTGKYIFYIAGDDKAELWLSGGESASTKQKIAEVTSYTASRDWNKYPSQKSVAINLEAGKKYYIEAIHKEASGGDNLAVGWQLANGSYEMPIPANRFAKATVAPTNTPPVLSLKESVSITLPTNTLTITGSATDADGTIASYAWRKVSGPSATMEGATTASLVLKNLVEGSYVFELKVTDNGGATAAKQVSVNVLAAPVVSNTAPKVSLSSPSANASFVLGNVVEITASASDADGSVVKVEFYAGTTKLGEDTSSPFSLSWKPTQTGNFNLTAKAVDNAGATTTSASVAIVVENAPEAESTVTTENQVPVADAGSDKTIQLPTNSTAMSGSAYDADGRFTAFLWEKVSGPSVSMSGQNTANVKLNDLQEGSYVFRFSATDDGGATGTDEMSLTVLGTGTTGNQAPVVNAGSDKTLTLPSNTTSFTATASDADGSISSFNWVKVSGPAATLSGATTNALSLANLVEGSYSFKVTVTDNGGATASDLVNLTVNASTSGNQVPVADAGLDKTIQLPNNSINLSGKAHDADGRFVAFLWEKVSGPSVSMNKQHTANVKLSDLQEGSYVFRFSATDNGGATDSDEMTLTVLGTGTADNQLMMTDEASDELSLFSEDETQLTVYPNTFVEHVNLKIQGEPEVEYQVTVFDMMGETYYQGTVTSDAQNVSLHKIDLSGHISRQGMYMIQVENMEKTFKEVVRIIKMK